MRKLDSFLKECQRTDGLSSAVKDFTFPDGTVVPKGMAAIIASQATYFDNGNHNASTFYPFRFADVREEGGEAAEDSFISTNCEYLAFGHGKHATIPHFSLPGWYEFLPPSTSQTCNGMSYFIL
ncbi:hypothetical protein PAXRUDRAFT_833395 [Paxillus rubicundulus Ve08.2h10]|uniref:Uncharacterized protein n=1 Tax=Paxillus rubicundulus Ve08.2h10 TaxID=930991 RepID=A0A0D0DP80_9AGAM|nr:hypothetical protein PAXRUDRAFT_833395 [Paxillus rubicundulus Ve08.2h10]